MLDYRTILHPTDFSEPALWAFELARDLARWSDCDLLVLHVAPARLSRKRGYRRDLEEALRQLTASDLKLRMHGLLLGGDPAAQIVCTAHQINCDLIVMGTNGQTRKSRLQPGSVAAAVQKDARCPVLTVHLPDREEENGPSFEVEQFVGNGRVAEPLEGAC